MQRVCYWGSSQQVRGFAGANGKAFANHAHPVLTVGWFCRGAVSEESTPEAAVVRMLGVELGYRVNTYTETWQNGK